MSRGKIRCTDDFIESEEIRDILEKISELTLNEHQYTFFEEYFKNGFNGKQAAIKAGSKDTNAARYASELLRVAELKPYVKEAFKTYAKYDIKSKDDLCELLDFLCNFNVLDIVDEIMHGRAIIIKDIKDIPKPLQFAVKSIEETMNGVKITFVDKLKAFELMARMRGWMDETLDISISGVKFYEDEEDKKEETE